MVHDARDAADEQAEIAFDIACARLTGYIEDRVNRIVRAQGFSFVESTNYPETVAEKHRHWVQCARALRAYHVEYYVPEGAFLSKHTYWALRFWLDYTTWRYVYRTNAETVLRLVRDVRRDFKGALEYRIMLCALVGRELEPYLKEALSEREYILLRMNNAGFIDRLNGYANYPHNILTGEYYATTPTTFSE